MIYAKCCTDEERNQKKREKRKSEIKTGKKNSSGARLSWKKQDSKKINYKREMMSFNTRSEYGGRKRREKVEGKVR